MLACIALQISGTVKSSSNSPLFQFLELSFHLAPYVTDHYIKILDKIHIFITEYVSFQHSFFIISKDSFSIHKLNL